MRLLLSISVNVHQYFHHIHLYVYYIKALRNHLIIRGHEHIEFQHHHHRQSEHGEPLDQIDQRLYVILQLLQVLVHFVHNKDPHSLVQLIEVFLELGMPYKLGGTIVLKFLFHIGVRHPPIFSILE